MLEQSVHTNAPNSSFIVSLCLSEKPITFTTGNIISRFYRDNIMDYCDLRGSQHNDINIDFQLEQST